MLSMSTVKYSVVSLLLLFILHLSGCQGSTVPDPSPEELNTTHKNAKPLTEQEINSIISQIDQSVVAKNPKAYDEVFNIDILLDHTLKEFSKENELQHLISEFKKNTRQLITFEDTVGYGTLIIAPIQHPSHFKLLRIHEVDGKQRLLYRIRTQVGGFTYHDYILGRTPDNQPAVIDAFFYIAGENYSTTILNSFLPHVENLNLSLLEQIAGKQNPITKHLAKLSQIEKLLVEKKYPEVLKQYHSLPPEVQLHKMALLMRLQASQQHSLEEYTQALNTLLDTYPDDPGVLLMSIDAYLVRQEADKAIDVLKIIHTKVNGDPNLKRLEAEILLEYTNPPNLERAKELAEEALDAEPDLIDGYVTMIRIVTLQKSHETVLKYLKLMDQKIETEWNIESVEMYADFIKSPQYQQWLDYLAQKEQNTIPVTEPNE